MGYCCCSKVVVPNQTDVNVDIYSFEPLVSYSDPQKELKESQKELIENILKNAPKRENSTFQELCNYLKLKTKNLNIIEKAWLVFRWMSQNIKFDKEGLSTGKYNCDPENFYKKGYTICEGYSKMYKNIGECLGLEIEKIYGYAKGAGFKINVDFKKINHVWNAIKINNEWYFIESTWGSGYIKGEGYVQEFNPFYFCPNPSYFIKNHFPQDSKWQLLKKPISMKKYMSMPWYLSKFFSSGLKNIFPEQSIFKIDTNTGSFKILYDNTKEVYLTGKIDYLNGDCYCRQNNCVLITKYKNYFLIEYITNKKCEYQLNIFSKILKESINYTRSCQVMIICGKNAEKEINFPEVYNIYYSSDVQLISPKFNDFKQGQNIDFKLKTYELNVIKLIIDGRLIDMIKNDDNIFEAKNVLISGNKVSICTKGDVEGRFNKILSFINIPDKPN